MCENEAKIWESNQQLQQRRSSSREENRHVLNVYVQWLSVEDVITSRPGLAVCEQEKSLI